MVVWMEFARLSRWDFDSPSLRPEQHLIQRHALRIAAALGIPAAARVGAARMFIASK